MLSLLSLIIASGTVLRADTEQWEPTTYPDPRTNATQCNTVEDSTLCDPDRILTDTWRQAIHNNIVAQTNRLQNADIKYTENATEECREGSLTGIRIFVILARRINTTFSQNITSNDLTNFGHGIREAFGLDMLPCKNYILVLAVELAKEIYVWTGSDLALPEGRMETSLEQYKNLFLERNYMQGLNKLVDEIGNVLADPYKGMPISKSENEMMFNSTVDSYSEGVTTSSKETTSAPFWVFTIIFVSVSAAVISLMMLVVLLLKRNMAHDVNSYTVKNEKPGYM
ncbi:hypothetical protein RB195_025171 [Necator americanus]